MTRMLLLVGTRKGCSCWRATTTRGLEAPRAVLRELARLPRRPRPGSARSTPRPRASGTAPRSGAAPISARRGSTRARASPTRDGDAEALEGLGLAAAHGRLLVGAEAAGIFESTRRRRDLVAAHDARRPAGPRGLERPGEPAARPPRHLGDHPAPRRRDALLGRSSRASASSRRPTAATTWTPRNRGLRADWPLEDEEVGFCVHKLVLSPADGEPHVPAEPRRHAPQRRRRAVLDGDHRGPADRVRLRRRRPPARPRHAST